MNITDFRHLKNIMASIGISPAAHELLKRLTEEHVSIDDPSELIYGESGIFYIGPDGILVKVILHISDFNIGYYTKAQEIKTDLETGNFETDKVLKNIHKYHLVNCGTLKKANDEGWKHKYNISRRKDGTFFYRFLKDDSIFKELDSQKLRICKNCLDLINKMLEDSTEYKVTNFTPDVFFSGNFKQYISKDGTVPIESEKPANIYPPDWKKIAAKYKKSVHYKCENHNCIHSDLSSPSFRQYLDCHHKDMDKSNTDFSNLEALCIICHAKKSQHGHVKSNPRYKAYINLLKSINIHIDDSIAV